MITKNIKSLKGIISKNQGFDIIIVVSSNHNSKYWEWRLSQTRKTILSKKTKIICVEENGSWRGGAGQLLGTLYALQKANKIIKVNNILKKGGTVAMYHTAGYGKRMSPLCGTEGNNKPAIKLPSPIEIEKKPNFLTLLEAVILSTQIFAKTRNGRLCVFWGDQVIIPSRNPKLETSLPVEIFGIKKEFLLSREEWGKNWKSYGILIPKRGPGILQREKITWNEVKELEKKGYLKSNQKGEMKLSKSMGCFSINFEFLEALNKEFEKELEFKNRKLNTDPDLWVPLTSTKKEFLKNNIDIIYWKRINRFKKRFQQENKNYQDLIGEKNLGRNTLWWDYGNLASYHKNLIKITEDSDEGRAERMFFGVEKFFIRKERKDKKNIKNSIIINSEVGGTLKNSIVLGSKIEKANLENSIVINSKIKTISGKSLVLYYLEEEKRIKVSPMEVITDIVLGPGTKIRMKTDLTRDSKKDWEIKLPQNPFSYREMESFLSRLGGSSFKCFKLKIR